MKELNDDFEVFIDEINPSMKIPFKYNYLPTWCLLDWSDKVDMLRMWFLPEVLGNHKVFKKYAVENLRNIYKSEPNNENKYNIKSKYSYKINKTCVPLPENNLDNWIIDRLNETNFMNDKKWYKPDTCPSTSIKDYSLNLPGINNTSKLSPFIALGVLSPLTAYNFYSDENRTGSSRDQLLFREMFHACAQMPEYWSVDFGKEYDWKTNKIEWNKYINGETGHEDLDRAMKQLKNEGWLHHLARHLVADYLTRGKLEIHWIDGANWFKENLVDHDDCVNRKQGRKMSVTISSLTLL